MRATADSREKSVGRPDCVCVCAHCVNDKSIGKRHLKVNTRAVSPLVFLLISRRHRQGGCGRRVDGGTPRSDVCVCVCGGREE